jgi:mannose-6-phosphate isomerase
MIQDKIFMLTGKVQHYAWGGFSFIPNWLQTGNADHTPCAEYWMGAHPSASSVLATSEGDISLQAFINAHPEQTINSQVFNRFGELPYLFKILDVKDMLSIQVHPSKPEAEKGFAAEEAAGVPINAPTRNYKDKNHKPEVMVALSEFWLLHGFLEKTLLQNILATTTEFAGLADVFAEKGYKGLYQFVMELPQERVNTLLSPLVIRELERKRLNQLEKSQPGWWVAKLYGDNAVTGDIDRGIFSIYFFNIVQAQPGEAVFQGAGIPHAYMEGQNMELMANSDNVLRGGLTPKHVDIPELLKHTTFEGIIPNIMKGEEAATGEKLYPCPVPDFGISKIELTVNQSYSSQSTSLEIIAVMQGSMQVSGTNQLTVSKGQVVAILQGENYKISTTENVLAYKAFVP